MIISVEDAKTLLGDVKGWTDERLSRKLKAIEDVIRSYTNNNFQNRGYRKTADIVGGLFINEALTPFVVGDTVQIHDSAYNDGIYTIISADETTFSMLETVKDERNVLVTRVDYPEAVKDCALNLLEWEIKHRDKVGIQSETLSRHSVTYFAQDASNQIMGYPASLLGCLKAYKKARF